MSKIKNEDLAKIIHEDPERYDPEAWERARKFWEENDQLFQQILQAALRPSKPDQRS